MAHFITFENWIECGFYDRYPHIPSEKYSPNAIKYAEYCYNIEFVFKWYVIEFDPNDFKKFNSKKEYMDMYLLASEILHDIDTFHTDYVINVHKKLMYNREDPSTWYKLVPYKDMLIKHVIKCDHLVTLLNNEYRLLELALAIYRNHELPDFVTKEYVENGQDNFLMDVVAYLYRVCPTYDDVNNIYSNYSNDFK